MFVVAYLYIRWNKKDTLENRKKLIIAQVLSIVVAILYCGSFILGALEKGKMLPQLKDGQKANHVIV